MARYDMYEVCKEDGVMPYRFAYNMTQKGFDLYCVCEFSGMEIKLNKDECEFRNGVKYSLKWNGGGVSD